MNLVSIENVHKSFGERVILHDISFGINKDQKIAFVAKNGTGKTTLLNIIAGKDSADIGQVVFRKGLKVAYLSQKMDLTLDLTVEESIFNADNPILKIIEAYEHALEHPEDSERYQKAFDEMELHHAWDFETQYKQILYKLKLENLHQKVSELSGGQQKRLGLAICLLMNPDLLILDEPTNHLDLEMIEWLETYLQKTKLTLFMVTHDRYFLERVCNDIVELDEGIIYRYTGNYSYFLEKKEARLAIEQATVDKAKNLYVKELDWMRRMPQARTTKSKSRIDAFYKTEEVAKSRRKEHQVQLEINMERLGSKVVELHKVSKSFGENTILKSFEYVFQREDRVGIIGNNGSGKSTLLNLITGSLKPDSGKIIIGDTVKMGYYTQEGIIIKPGQKVLEVIREFGEYIPLTKGRTLSAGSLLEKFLFDRKQQYDFVEKLSGGELKRLFLCTVLIQNPNFLILDEPTNDLDIITLNVLEDFLLDYPGTLVVVSHDRYFMDKIVDHLFVLKDGIVKDFPGNYSDYRDFEMFTEEQRREDKSEITTQIKTSEEGNKDNFKKVKLSYNEKKEFEQIEKELVKLNLEKAKIETDFVEVRIPEDQMYAMGKKLEDIISQINQKEERWLDLSLKME
ncbi:MAG: ABC-F family ATP-binding cassette domain-containing protein [Flavobacteriaceae bacterium]|nr:ABC-F family ATP-binding cassette domain-containing protein [Flavobacteriaceae bacterium]